ncbi:MAG: Asp-tRNA(Asn)/Glu-tRNA(Gln) amidotransferase subunit GatA [Kofleriaceae bacterium]|nr:Asp-tRNA(Asn)/Glu-tRNA(Gln) amidotransferase subunit GatA [Kofleriaceae bacterium]MCB9574336.1 Asp-tRNA(Asn)/Glu-tRNA(Gln) amidotransferase subunit GatA [Kofleriaceae bacterium]
MTAAAPDDDGCWLSAAEQARQVKAGARTARALVDGYLARIAADDRDPRRLGAYLHVDADGARARADAIDAAIARGDDPGPLAGVPVALKDVLVTEGVPTTASSKILAGWVPPYDGTAVARLRAAGAIVLGKTSCDEFAMGSANEHAATGPVRNPWDRDRVPGGSSGGSAAAVAAGLCGAALGTDTGGSIRQPASFCGVVGLKPTYGRVSRYGAIAYASSLDQIGPMARTVEDVALLTEIIAGVDPHDATSIDAPAPALRAALDGGARGLRVGLPEEYFAAGVDPEVAAAVERALAILRDAGAETVPVSLPHTRYALAAYYVIAPAEASSNLSRYDGVRFGRRGGDRQASLLDMYRHSRGDGFGAEVKRRIMLGTFALRSGYYDAYYKKAQQVRALIARDFTRAFDDVDVLAAPVAPTAAWRLGAMAHPIDEYRADVLTLACNLAGLPGLSVPCGFTGGGLPVGLQLLGRPLDEATLVRAARVVERGAAIDRRPA